MTDIADNVSALQKSVADLTDKLDALTSKIEGLSVPVSVPATVATAEQLAQAQTAILAAIADDKAQLLPTPPAAPEAPAAAN